MRTNFTGTDMLNSFQEQSKYMKHAFYSGNTGINKSVCPLLPSPHRPISPAAPDGLVWWLPSQETWPGPLAPVYLSVNLPLVRSGRSLAGPVKQQRSTGGSRWRWCDGFSSSRAPLDFLNLRGREVSTPKKWQHPLSCLKRLCETVCEVQILTLIHPIEDCF